ncbi:A disintegrin and metalloproteinase with thrombospondin motifs adt-2-like isoform X2 [Dreissena polymorpha]|uniref:Peptidase M12B domain-containing protein n=1 Tax=Dreissena polymorpha TaxID=45954 RepID=A0A9D4BU86_DREPO|nr:A disintegrin and metalloproteinase with thrombospondin motifs adt-2-like isoform X2 [Dreissena polymorpha]KAH3708917.1 hypothetical protein DPMN_068376 [Dreissena polymorpha]
MTKLGLLVILVLLSNAVRGWGMNRATGTLELELLVVVDYSAFNKWYQQTNSHSSQATRVSQATQAVKEYISTLVHSSNLVYTSLEPYNIYISLKLVEISVKKTPQDSPWTETVKVAQGSDYVVDPTQVLPLFQPYSEQLQRTVPHDHAMLYTEYGLSQHGGSPFSGYAYLEAECQAKSVSIVSDEEDFYASQLIAHEIGHSLGCEHDGNGNPCSSQDGYAMEAGFLLANKNKWKFSTCSVDYIRKYIQVLNTNHTNCLTTTNNGHVPGLVTTLTHEWYGQVYKLDKQCQIKYGQQSYFCREQYRGNYTGVCLKMFCYDTVKRACFYLDGGDGTPCGSGKWCMSNECVTSSQVASASDNCVAGDQPGVIYNGHTCQQIQASFPTECNHGDIKYRCCDACAQSHVTQSHLTSHVTQSHVTSLVTAPATPPATHSSADIDAQCVRKHGAGSYLCRGAVAYNGKTYADVICSDVQCHDPSRDNWCLSSVAEEKTTCGNRKWCINGVCVADNSAPSVSADCPYGDQQGVASNGLTCAQIAEPANHWRCYDSFTSRVCCASCNSIRRSVTGCEFGDKSDWCQTHIGSQTDKQTCYWGHNEDLCCESCRKYRNDAHVGCEFGDKINTCQSVQCARYNADTKSKCCETCRSIAIIG